MSLQTEPRPRAEPRRTPAGDSAGPAREGLGLLVVTGPPWARAAADGVVGLGVLSLLAATYFDGVAVAVMSLVVLGLVLPRVAGVTAALQAASGAVLLGAAWPSVLGGYERLAWLDVVVHLLGTGVLAAVAVEVLLRTDMLRVLPGRRGAVGRVLVTLAVGLALSVLWEMGEWFGHTYVDEAINVGYDDTVGDLATGGLGSLLVGLALSRSSAPTSGGR
jgi:hypothetical protein